MTRYAALFLSIFATLFSLADQTRDLERAVDKAKGEKKVDLLYQLAERYHAEDKVRTAKVAIESGDEAAKLKLYRKAYEGYYYGAKVYQERNNIIRSIKAFEQAAEQAEYGGLKKELMDCYRELAEMNAGILRSKVALDYYKKYTDLVGNKIKMRARVLENDLKSTQNTVKEKESEIDELEEENEETLSMLDSVSKEKLFSDLNLAEQKLDNERIALELSEERNRRNLLIGAALVALLIGVIFYIRYQNKKNANIKLAAKNEIIEQEREKSENLLLNILPKMIAGELKEAGKTTPRSYSEASVLFTDFKSFTTISEKLTPIELVEEINHCFTNFDRIISKYNIEKIKTIGDAYLCVSGLPKPNENHSVDLIQAAMEMQQFMADLAEQRKKEGRLFFEMRLGIHTGPLVAGVVGSKKFAYDIWGDTVNTAARMEQNCEAGKINVSEAVKNEVGNAFTFEYRGKVEAKNKGELSMYYVSA